MRDLAGIYRALGHETRLRILVVLHALGELCVCDIENGLRVTQSRASRHLATLRRAGLVEDRRRGPWVYYRLHPHPPEKSLDALAALFESGRDAADIESTRAARRSPCA